MAHNRFRDSVHPPSDEFCYQKHVKQIHRNDDGTTQEVLLGIWDAEYHQLKVNKQKSGGGQRSTTSVTLYYKDVSSRVFVRGSQMGWRGFWFHRCGGCPLQCPTTCFQPSSVAVVLDS